MPVITALELASQVRYIADGKSVEFPITFERLDNNHVKAWLYDPDKDEVTELARSIAGNIATITPPPNQNDYVVVHRETPKVPMVDWATTGGESRNSRVLSEKQLRYIALEARDWSQYPIRSIVATTPPPFTWRQVAPGETLNNGDNNHGVDFTAPGTLRIPPAVGQEREFSVIIRLPVGTTTIIAGEATIDGQESIDVTATGEDRLLGILLREPGVFNTAGRHQATVRVEDVDGIGAVGADLLLCQTQPEGWEALGLSNAVEYSVSTGGDATASQLVKGGDSRLSPATASKTGTMSAADKSKLDGIAAGANNYTHPFDDGNQHVPATGTTSENKVLVAGNTAGSASWQTFSYAWLTGTPSSLPASDVYAWAKQPAKPTYTNTEVGAAAESHTHSADAVTSGTISNSRLSSALAYIGALTPTTGGTPFYTASGGPASLYTTSSWFRGTFAPVADAAAAQTALGMRGNAFISGLNADLLDGYHVGSAQTSTTGPFIPTIGADGMLEVGRYLDFHRTLGNGDSDARLELSGTAGDSNLYINGSRIWRDNNVAAAVAALGGLTPVADRVPYYTSGSGAELAVLGAWVRTTLLPAATQLDARNALAAAAAYHTEHSSVLQYPVALRGSVVQTTSHTTAVTLNAAQGSIKMASGDIAAGTSVDFQFNNSYITASAMPVLARRGTEWPAVTATMLRFVPGYCIVRVTNTGTTAVTSAEPSLSFTILGVASA